MSSIIVRHRVADFDKWKAAYDEHGPTRREYGLTDVSLLRDTDDPNAVTILFGASDPARTQAFVSSDDLREVMTRAGVVSKPDVWFATEV